MYIERYTSDPTLMKSLPGIEDDEFDHKFVERRKTCSEHRIKILQTLPYMHLINNSNRLRWIYLTHEATGRKRMDTQIYFGVLPLVCNSTGSVCFQENRELASLRWMKHGMVVYLMMDTKHFGKDLDKTGLEIFAKIVFVSCLRVRVANVSATNLKF